MKQLRLLLQLRVGEVSWQREEKLLNLLFLKSLPSDDGEGWWVVLCQKSLVFMSQTRLPPVTVPLYPEQMRWLWKTSSSIYLAFALGFRVLCNAEISLHIDLLNIPKKGFFISSPFFPQRKNIYHLPCSLFMDIKHQTIVLKHYNFFFLCVFKVILWVMSRNVHNVVLTLVEEFMASIWVLE